MDILFEDAHLLVVAKPPGLSTQAPAIAGETLEIQVRKHLAGESGSTPFVGTVHRLDRPVSGVVLWAKSPRDARRLSRQFENRVVRKVYWAVVERPPGAPSGKWQDCLVREDTGLGRVQTCVPGTPRSQLAVTCFRGLDVSALPSGRALLELQPETGRMHQLRVQTAAHAGPVLGDRLYGASTDFPAGIALHARSLTVRHPVLDHEMTFEAELPPSWLLAGIALGEPSARSTRIP